MIILFNIKHTSEMIITSNKHTFAIFLFVLLLFVSLSKTTLSIVLCSLVCSVNVLRLLPLVGSWKCATLILIRLPCLTVSAKILQYIIIIVQVKRLVTLVLNDRKIPTQRNETLQCRFKIIHCKRTLAFTTLLV